MKKIKLTQDKYTTVDDCDYVYLMQWKWSLLKTKYHLYAQRRHGVTIKVAFEVFAGIEQEGNGQ